MREEAQLSASSMTANQCFFGCSEEVNKKREQQKGLESEA
jgi:hypothetical protein